MVLKSQAIHHLGRLCVCIPYMHHMLNFVFYVADSMAAYVEDYYI